MAHRPIDRPGHRPGLYRRRPGGGGVEIFDPATATFTHYSRDLNLRVASLAFAPDGTLWATTWPDRRRSSGSRPARAEVMLTFDSPTSTRSPSARPGTRPRGPAVRLAQQPGPTPSPGSELTMVDVATLRRRRGRRRRHPRRRRPHHARRPRARQPVEPGGRAQAGPRRRASSPPTRPRQLVALPLAHPHASRSTRTCSSARADRARLGHQPRQLHPGRPRRTGAGAVRPCSTTPPTRTAFLVFAAPGGRRVHPDRLRDA